MKNKTMTFWKDNRLDQEYQKPVDEIVDEFIASEYGADYKTGEYQFQRLFLLHLGYGNYGGFDIISDDIWKEIETLYKEKTRNEEHLKS
jgi:hypothetical protein